MESPQELIDAITERLSILPGKREFQTSVLISQPRKSPESLFPYAPNVDEAEIYIQDVVILVAEKVEIPPDHPVVAPLNNDHSEDQAIPATSFAYVSALEAVVYIFPETHSGIIYISKVDSTGQGKKPSPTRALMLSFLHYITTRWFNQYTHKSEEKDILKEWDIWIQLFARAQNQYLFPASIEYPGKRVLSDIGLVKWWKHVLDEYLSEVVGTLPSQRKQASKYITIPGLSPAETTYALKLPTQTTPLAGWIVGTPYSASDISFPLGIRPPNSISQLIPFFPDDPKARLIVEIANTTTKGSATLASPPRKRRKLEDGQASSVDGEGKEGEVKEDEGRSIDYLRTVSAEEFWERMDGRQECRLGTVAFFTVYVRGELAVPQTLSGSTQPRASSRRAEVPLTVVRKVSATLDSADFGTIEKSCRSTERLQDSIKALTLGDTSLTSRVPGIDGDAEDDGEAPVTDEQELLSHIIRNIEVCNPEIANKPPPEPVAAPVVTVLAVRKKKKPAAT